MLNAAMPTANARENGPAVHTDNGRHPKVSMSGRITDILLHVVIFTIAMLALSAILLGLVYRYRVEHTPATTDRLQLPEERDEPGIVYVNFPSTRLIFVASWASSLAPLLVSSVVVLMSYPISQHILVATKPARRLDLPTPYQLVLALGMLAGGGFGALWNWLMYLVGWRKERQCQGQLLSTTGATLVCATFLR
jgi:hypothetical protein